jgi:hypothetical protein
MAIQLQPAGGGGNEHVVFRKVAGDHPSHGGIIIDDEYVIRLSAVV